MKGSGEEIKMHWRQKMLIYYIGGPKHGESISVSMQRINIMYREYNQSIRLLHWKNFFGIKKRHNIDRLELEDD